MKLPIFNMRRAFLAHSDEANDYYGSSQSQGLAESEITKILLFYPRRHVLLNWMLTALIISGGLSFIIFLQYWKGVEPVLQNGAWAIIGGIVGIVVILSALALHFYIRTLVSQHTIKDQHLKDFVVSVKELSGQVAKKSSELKRRLLQIRTAAEINATITSTLDLDILLPQMCDLVRDRFGLYYAGVFLIEPGSDRAVLVAGTGDAGRQMLASGHYLKVGGESMIGWATANRMPRIALDVQREDELTSVVRFNNPYLPETRSELALPIISNQSVLGAMTIQSTVEAAFDQDDIIVLQSIASSLANAIENAHLIRQLQTNLDLISTLHRQYLRRGWRQVIETKGRQEYIYDCGPSNSAQKAAGVPVQVPIRLRDQQIGCLTLETSSTNPMEAEEISWVEAVVNQAALALENARLLDETRQRADREALSAHISTQIWSSSNLDTILRRTLQELGSSLEVDQGSIELWPEAIPSAASHPSATHLKPHIGNLK